jgi:hypothetical protein
MQSSLIRAATAVFLFAASYAVVDHYVIRPRQEDARRAQEALARSTTERLFLNACLADADEYQQAHWEKACKTQGHAADCSLPLALANSLHTDVKDLRDECFKLHPVQ